MNDALPRLDFSNVMRDPLPRREPLPTRSRDEGGFELRVSSDGISSDVVSGERGRLGPVEDPITFLRDESGRVDPKKLPSTMEGLMQFALDRADGETMNPAELLAIQIQMHNLAFQVETASKVIEHAMQGTKTLLQTQA